MDSHQEASGPSPEVERRPVHILHVIGSLSPADGGPPEAVRQLAKAYRQIGDTLEVVSLDPPDAPFLKDIPCPAHALGPAMLGRFRLSLSLVKWLEANVARFDGIVMQGIWTFPGIAVRTAARKAALPYCVFAHGALDPWFNKKYPLKHFKKKLYWPIQYAILRDAAAVLFTTPMERDLALTSFQPNRWNSMPIPYGVGEPVGDPVLQIETFYKKIPALRARRYLLFLGRLHEKKGCDLLLGAFANLASQFPNVDLVIAGPDQVGIRAKLQQIAAERGIAARVHWPGMLSGDLKWGALRASDAFVLPSHQENFGISVVESLAAGRPVLISNQVNIWPELEEERVALVDDDALEGTERLIRRWLTLPEAERKAMAARSNRCFGKRYSMKGTALAINDLFAHLRDSAEIQSPQAQSQVRSAS
jgi:glycosyltransferase involved in cell wall biosynthesis